MAKAKRRTQAQSSSASKSRAPARQQRQAAVQNEQNRQAKKQVNQRKMARRTNPWPILIGVVVVLAIIIGGFIFLSNQKQANSPAQSPVGTPVAAATLSEVTNVDPNLLSQTGTGGLSNPFQAPQGSPALLTGTSGKPEVFFYGAEFCPLCAAERWSVVVAMSRFGTFHNLKAYASSSTDSYPNTATFTFYQSSYTSSYIDFASVEAEDRLHNPLQTPTADEQQLVTTYDAPPYVAAQYAGGFPFMDIGNKYLINGPSYDPAVLRSNPQDTNSTPLTFQDIASQLSSGNTLSQNVLGAANYLTAATCKITGNQPASVCSNTTIKQIETALASTKQGNVAPGGSALAAISALDTADVWRNAM